MPFPKETLSARAALQSRDHIRTARQHFIDLDVETDPAKPLRHIRTERRLAEPMVWLAFTPKGRIDARYGNECAEQRRRIDVRCAHSAPRPAPSCAYSHANAASCIGKSKQCGAS